MSQEQQGTSMTGTVSKAEVGDEREQSGDDSQIVKGLLSHGLAFAFPVRGTENRGESEAGG